MTVFATYILALGLPLTVISLLWEQEIGSSNLSTPTRVKYQFSLDKSPVFGWGFLFHIYSYFIILYAKEGHRIEGHAINTPTSTPPHLPKG